MVGLSERINSPTTKSLEATRPTPAPSTWLTLYAGDMIRGQWSHSLGSRRTIVEVKQSCLAAIGAAFSTWNTCRCGGSNAKAFSKLYGRKILSHTMTKKPSMHMVIHRAIKHQAYIEMSVHVCNSKLLPSASLQK